MNVTTSSGFYLAGINREGLGQPRYINLNRRKYEVEVDCDCDYAIASYRLTGLMLRRFHHF